jgi:hypothetical protein
MADVLDNPLLGPLDSPFPPTPRQVHQNPGGVTPGAQTGSQNPNPLLGGGTGSGTPTTTGNPPLTQGGPPAADAPGGFSDPLQTPPASVPVANPFAGLGVGAITWLEELAIRGMLLTVGLVLIAGGFKIAAARGAIPGLPAGLKIPSFGSTFRAARRSARAAKQPAPDRAALRAKHRKIVETTKKTTLTGADRKLIKQAFPDLEFDAAAAV